MGFIYGTGVEGWTPVAHADGASALADNSYHALRNGAAGDVTKVIEVFIGGEATSSTVNRMAFRRLSTNGSTPTNLTPGPYSPNAAASSQKHYKAATTGPTIASTAHLLNLAMNAFGGIVRWVAAPGEEVYMVTVTAPNAETVLDSISGTGVVSTEIQFEAL